MKKTMLEILQQLSSNPIDHTTHRRSIVYESEEILNSVLSSDTQKRCSKVCELARTLVQAELKSKDAQMLREIPAFDRNEIQHGRVLGSGGFGVVLEIRGFHVEGGNKDPSKQYLVRHCFRSSGEGRYAVKRLKPTKTPEKLCQGLADLASETRFLATLPPHPNIIKLSGYAYNLQEDYFIILERLYDSLTKRLQRWKKQQTKYFFWRSKHQQSGVLSQIIHAAHDLSSAIVHLHQHGIIHRDLKPDNVGFDIREDIKVFDFGLAKDITRISPRKNGSLNTSNELFQITSMVGSPRYMAPEVALGKPYNESCDVYAFAIILWQMMTLKNPYEQFRTADSMKRKVWIAGERPSKKWLPHSLKSLFSKAWHPLALCRPTMKELEWELKKAVAALAMKIEDPQQRRLLTHAKRRFSSSTTSSTSTAKMLNATSFSPLASKQSSVHVWLEKCEQQEV